MKLEEIGWSEFFEKEFEKAAEEDIIPCRVMSVGKDTYKVMCEDGEKTAVINGKMRYNGEFPVTGDWCVAEIDGERAVIKSLLGRKTVFSRKEKLDSSREQIITANVDIVLIVMSLNKDFNLRRIERYISIVWESGAVPVIVLTKSDLCNVPEKKILEVELCAPGVEVFAVSSYLDTGIERIRRLFVKGKTISLVGSSGVGKSTLINKIAGKEIMATGEIREDDDRGRHVTTHREMIFIDGAVLIDNPGMREIQMGDFHEGFESAFNDIEALAMKCRYKDCRHENEPGCAVRQAIIEGQMDEERYKSYVKIKKEIEYAASRSDGSYERKRKEIGKARDKWKKQIKKNI